MRVIFMQANTVLSKNQAAAQLSVSIQTLDKMFKRGDLPRIQITVRRVGVLQSDINSHLEKNRRA
jgi:predicted DNA-binding transcriptional regulator AlpA